MITCKRDYLIEELELLGDRSNFYFNDFWITRSPIGGFTVVCIKLHRVEHFSNAERVVDFLSRYAKKLRRLI